MSNYVKTLFQDLIDETLSAQHRIDEIELEESNIKIKKAVLQNAIDNSVNSSDRNYFISEYERLKDQEKELNNEKTQQQELHRDLIRRVDLVQKSIKQYENQDV